MVEVIQLAIWLIGALIVLVLLKAIIAELPLPGGVQKALLLLIGLIILLLLLEKLGLAADKPAEPKRVSTPADAILAALDITSKIPEGDRPLKRFVWIPQIDEAKIGAVAHVLNEVVSHAPVEVHIPIAGELAILDLRQYATDAAGVKALVGVLASLEPLEPYFLDHATIDGKVANTPAAHLGEEGQLLAAQTGTVLPVLHYGWLIRMACTTLDGGKYYDFRGIRGKPQKDYLASRGASEEQVAALGSDERAVVAFSGITGKPRRIVAFRSTGVRTSRGTGFVSITQDVTDGQVAANQDPFRNLLDGYEDAAREIILELPSGYHEYTLFDGKGVLQDAAPDNVARDSGVPAPHTSRLQPAISCIRCHGATDDACGWKPFKNDVRTLLTGRPGTLDVFAADQTQLAAVDAGLQRLAGLYSGDLTLPMDLARVSYTAACARASAFAAKAGPDAVAAASKAVGDVFAHWTYDLVSPQQACLELGYAVDGGQALAMLAKVLPPAPVVDGAPAVEDSTLGLLKAGVSVTRGAWEFVANTALLRARQSTLSAEQVAKQQARLLELEKQRASKAAAKTQGSAERKPPVALVAAAPAVALTTYEQAYLDTLNAYRKQQGLQPATVDASLQAAARQRAKDMAAGNGEFTEQPNEIIIADKQDDQLIAAAVASKRGADLLNKPNLRIGVCGYAAKSGRSFFSVQCGS